MELSDVWEYRFASNTWGYLGEMPDPLTQSAAALLYASTMQSASQLGASRMVMFGGLSGGAPTDRTFLYTYTPTFRIYLPLVGKDFSAP